MLDTVTFDVWNTLLVHEFYDDRVREARIGRIERALRDAGFHFSREDVARAYDHSEARLSVLWKQERDIGLEGHVRIFLDGLGLEADQRAREVIRLPYSQALLDLRPVLVEGAGESLRALKEKGYRIGLISNTGRTPGDTVRIVLNDYGVLKYFDGMAFSGEVGYIKPNRRIFERALDSLDAKAESTVHVGDSRLLDVYGARAAGLKSILFSKYSERFERYAARYYDAGGRRESPDATVDRLADVEAAIEALGGIKKNL